MIHLGQWDLASMRNKLTVQLSAMNTLVSSINMATLGRREPMLERIFLFLDEQTKGSLEKAETVLSVKVEDKENDAAWALLEMDLRTEGISEHYFHESKDHVMEVVCSVVEFDHLDGNESDTIYANDSISQVRRSQGSPSVKMRKSNSGAIKSSISKFKTRKPRTAKSPLLPYTEWLRSLSPEQEAARIRVETSISQASLSVAPARLGSEDGFSPSCPTNH